MSSKFFREMTPFEPREEKYHYIPQEKFRLRTTIIENSEFEDDELVYTEAREKEVNFSTCRDHLPQFFIDSRVQVRMTETMGMGCFSLDDIPKNTLIESSPVLLVHNDTFKNLNSMNGGKHKLSEYPFSWGRDGCLAFSLGYGGLYNHNPFPSVVWRPNYEFQSMQFVTTRSVTKGEELFIRYLPLSKLENLWFYDEDSDKYLKQRGEKAPQSMGNVMSWNVK